MGRTRSYESGLYNQLEKLNAKIDKLINENRNQSLIIYDLKLELEKANKTIDEQAKKIELLIEENEKLKNKNDKNSTNSSKPSSTNISTPKTSANEYNGRTKTNKSVGGQVGHTPHSLTKEIVKELIDSGKVEIKEVYHTIKGNPKTEPIIKFRIGMEVKPYVEKHIFKYAKNSKEKLPKEFYTDVTYDNSIKALSIELGVNNVVSYERMSDFFNIISNDILNISNGTLVNFLYEFRAKSEATINNLEENLLNGINISTDETGAKFNKKNMFVRNYSNEQTAVYKAHKCKGHKPIKEDNILPRFTGGIMGDHDTTLYSYGTRNYECNVHLGRYLEELIQNIPDILWPLKMKELIFRMQNTRKIAMAFGINYFDKSKIKEYEKEFDGILDIAKEENKKISSRYYKDKAKKLYNRLVKYKKNHLYFIYDFNVDFDNNMSEQDLRIFKIKTKVSGGFRSMKGADSYVKALSIIKTSKKRKINHFDSIKRIFNNEILFSN